MPVYDQEDKTRKLTIKEHNKSHQEKGEKN